MEWLRRQFEISRETSGSNIRSMEGMRGFAVFLVFLTHYCTLVEPWLSKKHHIFGFETELHAIGNAGVDLFFVLSGYLIYGTLISRPQAFTAFMARRIKRIYPAFIIVFIAYCALSVVFPSESKIPQDAPIVYLLENLLLLAGIFPIEPMVTVAWSLSYEMFYYLVMPPIVVILNMRARSEEWRVLFVSLVAVLTALYCAHFGGHIRLLMFMAGILLYESVASRKVRTPAEFIGLAALAGGLLTMLLPTTGYIKISLLFVAFYVFCLNCFLRPAGWLAKWLTWTPMRWLGNMSYSYYLLHGLALKASFMMLSKVVSPSADGAMIFFELIPVMFALTLLPSAALFIFIERPFSLNSKKALNFNPGPENRIC